MNQHKTGLTEVTFHTTDCNDRPVAVGGICNLVLVWLWRWSGWCGLRRGLALSPDYRNKLFLSPPNTPFLLPVPNHELLHYCIKIMSYLCYKHLFQSVVCRVSEKNVPKPHTPRSVVTLVRPTQNNGIWNCINADIRENYYFVLLETPKYKLLTYNAAKKIQNETAPNTPQSKITVSNFHNRGAIFPFKERK